MTKTVEKTWRSDRQRWSALMRRDRRADGAFVYGVRTTGVYCRPGCSSRQPQRTNVDFFDTWQHAERAGFRACRKCRPHDAEWSKTMPPAVTRACELMNHTSAPLTLKELSSAVAVSPYHLHRLFKRSLGITPKAYAVQRRNERLRSGLRAGRDVARVIDEAGFRSASHCYEGAASALGMTPGAYGRGAAGLRLRYAIADSSLGCVLVGATDRGICAIELGDSRQELKEGLLKRFPAARRVINDKTFGSLVRRVLRLIDLPSQAHDLPLDIVGTAFQRRVWEALQLIPAGKTTTYAQLAREIGKPHAVRAVARACATNSLALVIPCHRVLGSKGELRGYRWGIQRKRLILDREAEPSPNR